MDDVKECSKCKTFSSKSNFSQDIAKKGGLNPICKICRKETFDLLGCSHSFFRGWIIHHFYGNMTIENYGSVWQIDHCLPIASFNLLEENEMKKCFNWINLRSMYSWCIPLKNKNSQTITNEFSKIQSTSNRKPLKNRI